MEGLFSDWEKEWPRRLLHVDSLTSYPWQPGNVYGGYTQPRYNVLSYTWGRFMLKPGEKPEIKAINIQGTTWEDKLPRIDPNAYTTEDFRRAIRTAACPCEDYPPVDFIWLDIACADQTPNSPDNAAELGKQAKIFRGASDTFVWLHSLTWDRMLKWIESMDTAFQAFSLETSNDEILGDLHRLLIELTTDPWFSSLWTLQEAFMCPQAIVLCRDELPKGLRRSDLGQMNGLIEAWAEIRGYIGPTSSPEAQRLGEAIDKIGFLDAGRTGWGHITLDDFVNYPSGVLGNPFKLLAASKYRYTTHDVDRVYGIMQVFNLRLGKSAPGETRSVFSLNELNRQFATAILENYPVLSQLVPQDKKCVTSNVRLSMMSVSPGFCPLAQVVWDNLAFGGRLVNSANMTTKENNGELWGCFTGPASLLADFPDVKILFFLDEPWHSEMYTELKIPVTESPMVGWFNEKKRTWALEKFNQPKVLLLGRVWHPDKEKLQSFCKPSHSIVPNLTDSWAIGMLLETSKDLDQRYIRLGIVVWRIYTPVDKDVHEMNRMNASLNGFGEPWVQEMDGLFI